MVRTRDCEKRHKKSINDYIKTIRQEKTGKVRDEGSNLIIEQDMFGGKVPGESKREKHVGFNNPDPNEITILTVALKDYLKHSDMEWIIKMRIVLQEMDWSAFESRYKLTGRSPFAPSVIMGLILYGTMSGISSLRGLEGLAKRDLGAMYLTGGARPNYSTLSQFIKRHKDLITESFFTELTKKILKATKAKTKVLAGDGTIVEGASSRYKKISLEVAREEARQAKEEAEANPDNEQLQKRNEQAQEVMESAEARAEERHAYGANRENTLVSKTEPEAAVLKTKEGLVRAAYVPSVVVNPDRIIVGMHVHPTSEIAAIDPMLMQAQMVSEGGIEKLLLDKGYGVGPVVRDALAHGVKVLASLKSPPGYKDGRFSKKDFKYDESRDVYVCPSGKLLTRRGKGGDKRRNASYIIYAARRQDCQVCPLRSNCTKAKDFRPRRIHRYSTDMYLEQLREQMKNNEEKQEIKSRKSMVEPVFSYLKGVQGLKRFKRFGLENVRVEFAIHACAYNLGRFLRHLGAGGVGRDDFRHVTPYNRMIFCVTLLYNRFYASRTRFKRL